MWSIGYGNHISTGCGRRESTGCGRHESTGCSRHENTRCGEPERDYLCKRKQLLHKYAGANLQNSNGICPQNPYRGSKHAVLIVLTADTSPQLKLTKVHYPEC